MRSSKKTGPTAENDGRALVIILLASVALKLSPILFQFLSILTELPSIVAQLSEITGDFVGTRPLAEVAS